MKGWKDRILNLLMLLAVAAAFIVTWLRPSSLPQDEQIPPLRTAAPAGTAARPASASFTQSPAPSPTAAPDPVQSYRLQRDADRQREEQALLALIESEKTSPETRAAAETELLQMQKNREIEWAVEAVLAGHGHAQGLCVARQGAVTIILNETIGESEAALLLHLAREVSGVEAENIRVAPL